MADSLSTERKEKQEWRSIAAEREGHIDELLGEDGGARKLHVLKEQLTLARQVRVFVALHTD